MEVYGVVYLITDKTNDMKYVGQTTRSVEIRFKEHFKEKTYIGRVMRKHGGENFSFEVIEECESREQLNEREIFWIVYFNCKSPNGYNCTDGGEGGKLCVESIAKISAKLKGRKLSPQHCAKVAAVQRGKKIPSQQCTKMSISHRSYSLYKNLLNEIDARQLSYRSLAKLMGLSNATVSLKICGKLNFTDKDKVKLEEIFGKPAEYLFQRD